MKRQVSVITSSANPHIKRLRSLATDKRDRRRERSFLLEGVRLVATALEAGAPLDLVLYAPEQLASTASGRALLAQIEKLPYAYAASEQAVAAACETVSPQGVVAAAPWPELETRPGQLVLILDGVQDPGNVGTLLRTAEAVGASEVICIKGSADLYSPKVVRSAMGAHFFLPLRVDFAWEDVASYLGQRYTIYAADAEAELSYFDVDWSRPSALVVGNEANGLSAAALQHAHSMLSIPMVGRSESLNAAVAGSVIMFEALRQRRNA